MMVSQEEKTEMAQMLKDALVERFQDDFVFDPISVVQRIDHYGDPYLHAAIVFVGNQELLDPGFTATLGKVVTSKLTELGIQNPMVTSFIDKPSWNRRKKLRDYYLHDTI